MKKSTLLERLQAALGLLARVESERRASRAIRDEIEVFRTATRAELDRAGPGGPKVMRVAYCRSERTGRYRTIAVNAAGGMGAPDARRLGREDARHVDEWVEVQAGSWAEATAAVRAGGGTLVRRNGSGELTRTPDAPPAPKPTDAAPKAKAKAVRKPKPKARKAAKAEAPVKGKGKATAKTARKGKKAAE